MEMSPDYHERTRLFSAKSFLGNFFAMGTPWLIALAGLEFFRGQGGNLADGMRYVSILIASALIPLACWWFFSLKEPGFAIAKEQQKSAFWQDMRTTVCNKTFLRLVVIIFTLAMGFNFVALFNYYITIFYLYGGNAVTAGTLLGINGTLWAWTGLFAVFPLNLISRRLGKNKTLLIAIVLMCIAQLSKIVCYNPQYPYLVLIPTVFLSSGMLMFFTLGSSMVGDICDEDELETGLRSEGSYYSVYWWFIKMGSAFASFVTGALLVYTSFDEGQNVTVESLQGNIAIVKSEAERWQTEEVDAEARAATLEKQLDEAISTTDELRTHFASRLNEYPDLADHTRQLLDSLDPLSTALQLLQARRDTVVNSPSQVIDNADRLLLQTAPLKKQAPSSLFRLRLVEIGLPLTLSLVSIVLTLGYPLTEERCYEIKEALAKRRSRSREGPG